MKFHPQKCKVVSIAHRLPPLMGILPNIQYFYTLGDSPLDYNISEKDLGVDINTKLNFNDQCNRLFSKANQQFGITKRTCYFVNDKNRRRVLYLTLVRSQFEHCSVIWRPLTKTLTDKLENLQKRALKWILFEEYTSYSMSTYILKCRQLNIMPLSDRFDFLDIIFFFKVVRGIVPVELPPYLIPYQENSRLRGSRMDDLCYTSTITPRTTTNALSKSFFYRTHTKWNNIPPEVRQIVNLTDFKTKLAKFMWDVIMSQVDGEVEDSYSIEIECD